MHPAWSTIVILLMLTYNQSAADDQPNEGVHPIDDLGPGFHIGDKCDERCSTVISHSFCNSTSNTCQCLQSHPIVIEGVTCVAPRDLHATCVYDQQCKSSNPDSACVLMASTNELRCICRIGFHSQKVQEQPVKHICIKDETGPLTRTSVPGIVAMSLGLSILSVMLCFLGRLFSSARWARTRRFADAGAPSPFTDVDPENPGGRRRGSRRSQRSAGSSQRSPPEIQLNGDDEHKSLDIEKQLYRPALYSCGSHSQTSALGSQSAQVRRSSKTSRTGSGNRSCNSSFRSRNNSVYSRNSITASGVFAGDSGQSSSEGGSRRTSAAQLLGAGDKEHAGQKVQFFSEWPEGFTDQDKDYEQHITIVPNPKSARRRGSMADYAFPELHSRKKSQPEPDHILIMTRTRTDKHGRRHSVAVPLVPPPDGEKFEGGYHVERNPITGGATLVPPPGVESRSSSRKSSVSSSKDKSPLRISREKLPPNHLPVTTSAQSSSSSSTKPLHNSASASVLLSTSPSKSSNNLNNPWKISRTSSRYRNRTISGMPTIGESRRHDHTSSERSTGARSKAWDGKQVPTTVPNRRHSVHSNNSSSSGPDVVASANLVKEMDRLHVRTHSIGPGASAKQLSKRGRSRSAVNNNNGNASNTSVSPRPMKRRPSRRSSSQGFLHFLDLAIAN